MRCGPQSGPYRPGRAACRRAPSDFSCLARPRPAVGRGSHTPVKPGTPAAMMGAMIDEPLLQKLLRDLVAIDSVNPTLVPGARGEAAASGFLRDFLRGHGLTPSCTRPRAAAPTSLHFSARLPVLP